MVSNVEEACDVVRARNYSRRETVQLLMMIRKKNNGNELFMRDIVMAPEGR